MSAAPAINHFAQFQGAFADAILSATAPIAAQLGAPDRRATESRFDVYRNNVVLSLINALAARYPAVRRMLWEETFNAVARAYILVAPPRSPVLLEYGQGFPVFLRSFGEGAARDYVADVAELESARVRAYHAGDATPIGAMTFANLQPVRFASMQLRLHPSVSLLKSRFPVVSAWASQQPGEDAIIREWKPESALIARPYADVEVRRLPEGSYEFLSALLGGATVAAAASCAQAEVAAFDLAPCLTVLITSDIVVELLSEDSGI